MNEAIAHGKHGFAHALLLVDLFVHHLDAEGTPIEVHCLIEVGDGDPHMINVRDDRREGLIVDGRCDRGHGSS